MRTALRKVGNSAGMIVPKAILDELGSKPGEEFDIRVEAGRIVATPLRNPPRFGWAEAAGDMGATAEEDPAWTGFGNDADRDLAW